MNDPTRWLQSSAEAFPRQQAYRDDHRVISYQQLWQDVQRQAQELEARGFLPQDRIALVPRNDYETLVVIAAILTIRAVACPISHRLPRARQLDLATHLMARWLNDSDPTPRTGNTASMRSAAQDGPISQMPATIVLSSGSTGAPKAVVHSLGAHVASANGAAVRIPLSPGDSWLWALPAFHVGGLSIPFRCALAGATVCGIADASQPLHQLIEQLQPTHLSLVPTQLRRLLDQSEIGIGSVRSVLVGGMAAPERLLRRAIERGLQIHTTYGLTEMASQVTTSDPALTTTHNHSGQILPGREIQIGSDREILVRGETLCLGYLKGGQISRTTDSKGWFHTRDQGHIDECGNLHFLGRMDNMFVSGGENIYPERIEAELLRIPAVLQAVVVAQKDHEFGARPFAFVQAESRDIAEWNRQLRTELAGFEIPIGYADWPEDAELAMKPDRTKLSAMANR